MLCCVYEQQAPSVQMPLVTMAAAVPGVVSDLTSHGSSNRKVCCSLDLQRLNWVEGLTCSRRRFGVMTLQVGYCQGMAFAAGVLLMYMPEAPAFRWGSDRLLLGALPETSVWAAVTCAALCIRLHCLPPVVLAAHFSDPLQCPQHSTIPKIPLQPFPVHLTEDTHQNRCCFLQHLQAVPAPDES